MAIVTDRQVRCLRTLLKSGKPLKVAAMRVDMDRKTARKYRDLARLPSELEVWPRAWRTREDPFTDVWEEVREKLELSPGLQANTLFAWLQRATRVGSPTVSCGRCNVVFVNGERPPGRPRRCSSRRPIIPAVWVRPISHT